MKNIFIIGAQSTGKTTIANTIEDAISHPDSPLSRACQGRKPTVIREVARNVLRTHDFTREDITTSPVRALQLQKHILQAQLEAETAASIHSPSSWYITDRSGIDPIVYASLFVGEAAEKELLASAAWNELERRMKEGLVFLCEAGTSWLTDDGTRLMPKSEEEWMEVDRAYRRLLEAEGIEYRVISRYLHDINERASLVTAALCFADTAS